MNVVGHFRDDSRGVELPSLTEIELTKQDKRKRSRGFYMDYRGNRVGIVATRHGPVFFCNGQFYLLQERERDYHFSLQRRKGRNFFRFEWRGEVKLRFVYPLVVYRDGRSRETDEVSDFCHWLVEAVKKKNFFAFYTLGFEAGDQTTFAIEL